MCVLDAGGFLESLLVFKNGLKFTSDCRLYVRVGG